MEGLTFEQPIEKETFERYLSHLEDLTGRIKRMEKRIEEVRRDLNTGNRRKDCGRSGG